MHMAVCCVYLLVCVDRCVCFLTPGVPRSVLLLGRAAAGSDAVQQLGGGTELHPPEGGNREAVKLSV